MTRYGAALKLKLVRYGGRHNPVFGLVAMMGRNVPGRKPTEVLGTYKATPNQNGLKSIEINVDRVKYYLGSGAQPTERFAWLLEKMNIMPPTPGQLHRSGQVSMTDETTWKVMYLNDKQKVIGVEDNDKALARVKGTPFEVMIPTHLPPIDKKGYDNPLHKANIELVLKDGSPNTPPREPLTEAERLRVLQAALHVWN